MDVDDVRRTLARQANALEGEAQGDRLAGVRGRVTATRRRRAAGSVAGVAGLAVAAVAVASQLTGVTAPAETGPALNPPITTSSPRFPETVGDRTLLGSRVSAVGETTVQLRVVPLTLDLAWGADCSRPARPGHRLFYQRLVFEFRINGHDTAGVECDTSPSVGGTTVGVSKSELRDFGVRPGEPTVVTARIVTKSGAPANINDARLGLAVYAGPPAQPVLSGNGLLTQHRRVGDSTYRLATSHVYDIVDPAASSQSRLAAATVDRLVVWGGRAFTVPVRVGLFVDGVRVGAENIRPAAQIVNETVLPAGGAQTVTVRVIGGQPTSGRLVTGIYQRVG
jgi:hypothetical protein